MLKKIIELREKNHHFYQFTTYLPISVATTAIDFAILNALILITGKSVGWEYTVFVAFAFLISIICGYFMNRYWTFNVSREIKVFEFGKYLFVYTVSTVVSVGIATFLVNVVGAPKWTSPMMWANISVAATILFNIPWNFLCMKYLVFEKYPQNPCVNKDVL